MTFTYLTNVHVHGGLLFKGLVHQKMKMVIIYSPPCCSRPIQTLLIFGTQINIFIILLIFVLHCYSGRPIFSFEHRCSLSYNNNNNNNAFYFMAPFRTPKVTLQAIYRSLHKTKHTTNKQHIHMTCI